MATQITKEMLESFLNCRLKGHLQLKGQHGTKSDYEIMQLELRTEFRRVAIEKLIAGHAPACVSRNAFLTLSVLKQEMNFLIDGILEDDFFTLKFDALKRVEGPSKAGDFHYVPVLFSEGEAVRREQRALLELCGILISRIQGRMPSYGIIYYGNRFKTTRVRLNADLRSTERLLRELKEVVDNPSPPLLILNDHCQICEFRRRCHEHAVREDNISLMRGLGLKEIKNYARKGILTVTQLSHTFRPRRKPKRAAKFSKKRYHALQALAIRDKRIYVFGTPELEIAQTRIFVDVESVSEHGYVYLIGMIIVENGTETRHSLWANDQNQEQQIFDQFMAIVAKHPDCQLYCYGTYERDFFKRLKKEFEDKSLVDSVLMRLKNILSLIYSYLYFPTHTNGLKEIGRFLGCNWSDPESSGLQSIVWRNRWESTRCEEWKESLLAYNLEDCTALKKITDLVYAIVANSDSKQRSLSLGEETFPVSSVQEVDKLTHDRKWGRVNYFHPEYEFINDCAYFDYQRDRVFVRTNKTLRRRRKKARSFCRHNSNLRVSESFTFTSNKCPSCGSDQLVSSGGRSQFGASRPRSKRAFDLVFTSGGIKRRVIESRSMKYRCLNCQQIFVPEPHERLDKHFHGLKSWAMYQHVAHRLSFNTIQTMIKEFFGIWIADGDVHMFKSLMASYYSVTYDNLLVKMLAGNLLHVDETEVKLQDRKGYVWVFSNLEEVVFMFKPTREGEFLKELLKGFKGVLVSDFYAAYDSLDCPQQKCLIHLIRDMNQELLNSPYDAELQTITQPFGILLRAIVRTVDEHGLKSNHLLKHRRAVSDFFERLAKQSFRSEAAEGMRERLLKYEKKLFTFLEYDGVPWNNNNAENAIKRFAYYREDTAGTMKENGLSDYLKLLSICHTCRYKSMSFLQFLLSKETNMDLYTEGKRGKRTPRTVEVYPQGFITSLARNREATQNMKMLNSIGDTRTAADNVTQAVETKAEGIVFP